MRSAILFGSRARGKFQPDSDADGAVLLAGHGGQFMPAKLAMSDMAFDVMLDTGIRVDERLERSFLAKVSEESRIQSSRNPALPSI